MKSLTPLLTSCLAVIVVLSNTSFAADWKDLKHINVMNLDDGHLAGLSPAGRQLPVLTDGNFHLYNTRRLQHEGWKIHVSFDPSSRARAKWEPVLVDALNELRAMDAYHKVHYLRGVKKIDGSYDRQSSYDEWIRNSPHQKGKLITIYPRDKDDAIRIAKKLGEVMSQVRGLPHDVVEGDVPIFPDMPIYLRYGEFDSAGIDLTNDEKKFSEGKLRDAKGNFSIEDEKLRQGLIPYPPMHRKDAVKIVAECREGTRGFSSPSAVLPRTFDLEGRWDRSNIQRVFTSEYFQQARKLMLFQDNSKKDDSFEPWYQRAKQEAISRFGIAIAPNAEELAAIKDFVNANSSGYLRNTDSVRLVRDFVKKNKTSAEVQQVRSEKEKDDDDRRELDERRKDK